MALFVLFLTVPLIEIALFVTIGGAIGLWWTLGIVIVTAILGTWLVRSQGAAELSRLRTSLETLDDPTEPLAHGAMILFSGALLLTPGFFTDFVGFLLLAPPVRHAAYRAIRSRVTVQSFGTAGAGMPPGYGPGQTRQRGDRVIEGEFEDVTPKSDRSDQPSGWTRH